MQWYLKSAKQGSKESLNSIGNMYFEGHGVDKDYSLAYVWFKLAEKNGMEMAALNVGIIQENLSAEELQIAEKLYDEFSQQYESDTELN